MISRDDDNYDLLLIEENEVLADENSEDGKLHINNQQIVMSGHKNTSGSRNL